MNKCIYGMNECKYNGNKKEIIDTLRCVNEHLKVKNKICKLINIYDKEERGNH